MINFPVQHLQEPVPTPVSFTVFRPPVALGTQQRNAPWASPLEPTVETRYDQFCVPNACNTALLNAVCSILTSSSVFASNLSVAPNLGAGITCFPTSQAPPSCQPPIVSTPYLSAAQTIQGSRNMLWQTQQIAPSVDLLPTTPCASFRTKRRLEEDNDVESPKTGKNASGDRISSTSSTPTDLPKPSLPPLITAKVASRCKHGLNTRRCKDCKASSVCEHNRRRSRCKACGGSGICEHGRQRNYCKECGGSGICEHNRKRTLCRDCGGSSICEHGRQRSRCRDCGGSQICEHDRRRSLCKDCGGSQICVHQRQRNMCKDCGGSQICQHKRRKRQCKECAALRLQAAIQEEGPVTGAAGAPGPFNLWPGQAAGRSL
mmetsp:Transcript_35957/g.72148  ORF Transcript_35957/g.72148 Transcript_35957/m.72148 type:complete len:375 (+) Transcript_35957:45-1169(+)